MPFDPTAPVFVPRSLAVPPSPPSPCPPASDAPPAARKAKAKGRKKKAPPSSLAPTPSPSIRSSQPSPTPSFGESDFPPLSADAAKLPTPAWGGAQAGSTWASAAAAAAPAAPSAAPRPTAAKAAEESVQIVDGMMGQSSTTVEHADKTAVAPVEDESRTQVAEEASFVYPASEEGVAPSSDALQSAPVEASAPALSVYEQHSQTVPVPASSQTSPLSNPSQEVQPAPADDVQSFEPPTSPSPSEPAAEAPSTDSSPVDAIKPVSSSLEAPAQSSDPLQSSSPAPASPKRSSTPSSAQDDPLRAASPASLPTVDTSLASSTSPASPVVTPSTVAPTESPAEEADARRAAIHSAIVSDELYKLQRLFSSSSESYFSLANDPLNEHTLIAPLHLAASKGRLEIVKFLVEEGGALLDLEDSEGENALHKAALHAHLSLLAYFLSDRLMGPHARDREGFTALHNAASRGHLEAVRALLDAGAGAYDPEEEGEGRQRGLDRKAKGGWTPLMCAAANGHVDIVKLLVETAGANPLVRNGALETAADVAAGVFEVTIYDILLQAERERWPDVSAPRVEPYDPLAVHSTIPVVVLENQRLDGSLKSRALHGGQAVFTSSGLGRLGRKDKWELRDPAGLNGSEGRRLGKSGKESVALPAREKPFELRVLEESEGDDAETAHFWLSDWAIDFSNPKADSLTGWSYAPSFSSPAASWTPFPPPALEALLSSGTLSSLAPRPTQDPEVVTQQGSAPWVRRRGWVRTMSRRLDLPPLPLLDRDGYLSNSRATADDAPEAGPPVGSFPTSQHSAGSAATLRPSELQAVDYLSMARRVLDGRGRRRSSSATDVRADLSGLAGTRKQVERAKLERALGLLENGVQGDNNAARVDASQSLMLDLKTRLDALRESRTQEPAQLELDDSGSDSDASEFLYTDASSARSGSTDAAPTASSLASSPERAAPKARSIVGSPGGELKDFSGVKPFPLPRSESALKAPSKKPIDSAPDAPATLPTRIVWQKDGDISQCQRCSKRFGLFLRKHHCRRCARIFCDACSKHRSLLPPAQIVLKPDTPFASLADEINVKHRICVQCREDPELQAWLLARDGPQVGVEAQE